MRDLATSSGKDSSSMAIKKADDYLQKEAKTTNSSCVVSGQDRTIINRGSPTDSRSTEHAQCGSAAVSTAGMGRTVINKDSLDDSDEQFALDFKHIFSMLIAF